jgi:adenylate kinase family enzyme
VDYILTGKNSKVEEEWIKINIKLEMLVEALERKTMRLMDEHEKIQNRITEANKETRNRIEKVNKEARNKIKKIEEKVIALKEDIAQEILQKMKNKISE